MAASIEKDVTVSCTSEYQDYSYNGKHEIWTLVSLKAPCHEEDESNQRAAMDIVAVLDKSGSMAGAKLELVKLTMEFILTQLGAKDRLGLITYDTNVYVDFSLMNMTSDNKEKALDKISRIRDGSCTNLCGGLMKGLCEIIDRPTGNRNDVASVLLFTDGLANEGIQNISGIVEAMKTPKKNCGPSKSSGPANQQAPHVGWLSKLFPGGTPENGNEQVNDPPMDSSSKAADATVYTFGFGADHNADMLKQISDAGNGMYYFIETEDKIGESFAHCLGGLMSTVAQGIQMEVNVEPGVIIKEVHSTRPCEQDGGQSAKVNIGDLQSEENRNVVIELIIDAINLPSETTQQVLFNVNVDYFNVITNTLETAIGSLGVLRPATETAHDHTNVSSKLTKEKCRVNMTKAMEKADLTAGAGDFEGAKVLLNEQITRMKFCKANLRSDDVGATELGDGYDAMVDDLVECQQNAADETSWRMKGKNMNMNMMQQYNCERSSMPDSKGYQSKSRSKAVANSKSFFKK